MSITVLPSEKQPSQQTLWPTEPDIDSMLVMVQNIEQSLRALKQALEHLRAAAMPSVERKTFSLYGIFTSTDVSWEDFQKAKQAWLKGTEGI